MDPLVIIRAFYPRDTPLRRLLLKHSEQVREKALAIAASSGATVDESIVSAGAMLHDIGIGACYAPSILCTGREPYIAHGFLGGAMLRCYGACRGLDLEIFARICERHTGSGLTPEDIRTQNLPIPPGDYTPRTPEEKLICLADKFFSKSGSMREKTLADIRRATIRFGADALARFDALCREFQPNVGLEMSRRREEENANRREE